MTEPLRIVFAGTPEFAAEHLKALLDSPYEIVAVYTRPDTSQPCSPLAASRL